MIDKPRGASSRPPKRTTGARPAAGKSVAGKFAAAKSFDGKPRAAVAKSASAKPFAKKPGARPAKFGDDARKIDAHKSDARKSDARKPDTRKPDTRKPDGEFKPRRAAGPYKKPTRSQRPETREAPARAEDAAGMRIAKVMARAGLCSRRDAELWIEEGRVTLNGQVLTSPAVNVSAKDVVTVDGEALAERERTRLFLFHKPRGLVTTDKDPEGRETIFDFLRKSWPDGPRVISVGRLDINTEGLLLLTNDGGLARVLELPSTGWMRRYRVRANGSTDQSVLDALKAGVTVDGIDYAGIEAKLDRVQGDNVWISMSLREGKNREIKRVLEHVGLYVNRLIRLSFGPFQLADLPEGAVEEVRTRVLKDQLGPVLAEEADVDFDSPIAEARDEPQAKPSGRGEKGARKKDEREPRAQTRGERAPREARTRDGHDDRRGAKPPTRGAGRGEARGARPDRREAPAPIEPSFKPRGARKHISAMREIDAAKVGERKKAIQTETADRKGRKVVVERRAPAVQKTFEERPDREEQRAPRGGLKSRAIATRAASTRTATIDGPFVKRTTKTAAASKNAPFKSAGFKATSENRGRPSRAPQGAKEERPGARKFAPRGRDAGKRDFDTEEAAHVTAPWQDQQKWQENSGQRKGPKPGPASKTGAGRTAGARPGGKPGGAKPTRPRRDG